MSHPIKLSAVWDGPYEFHVGMDLTEAYLEVRVETGLGHLVRTGQPSELKECTSLTLILTVQLEYFDLLVLTFNIVANYFIICMNLK